MAGRKGYSWWEENKKGKYNRKAVDEVELLYPWNIDVYLYTAEYENGNSGKFN